MPAVVYDDIPPSPPPGDGRVVGIGVFDGVHLGHRAVIRTVLEEAKRLQVPSLLFTFDRLPEEVLRPEIAPKRLMSPREKVETLERLGPDEIVVAHVKPELLGLHHSDFVRRILRERFNPGVVVVGEDFRFGRGGEGNVHTLTSEAGALGFQVITVPPVLYEGEKVSSTRIRTLLGEGNVEEAGQMLTMNYGLTGKVVEGKRLGRTLGYPTANLEIDPYRLIPGRGIYACVAVPETEGRYLAAVSIGVNPTVGEGQAESVEAYLLDYDGNLYGRRVSLIFHHRLRGEQRFASLEDLKDQIGRDVEEVRRLSRESISAGQKA